MNDIELGEHSHTRQKIDAPPNDADLRLAAKLDGDDAEPGARLTVRWLATGEVEVVSKSWVGVVRFSTFDVRVIPKYTGGTLRVLQMLEYTSGIAILRRLPADRPLPAAGKDLFDLVCLLLIEETDLLLRDGLLRDYRQTDDSLQTLRGRLRYRDQYLRHYGQIQQLECSFDDYDADNADNQLLAAALTVARRRAKNADIRFAAARAAAVLTEICQPPTHEAAWYDARIAYNRRNQRYRPGHELAKIVLDGTAFHDLFDTSAGANVGAFMLNMNTIFERFVTRLVTDAYRDTDLTVTGQHPIKALIRDTTTGRSYSTIRPDLVIERADHSSVPIDVKYKLYDARKLSTSDIYQAFTYAYALGGTSIEPAAGIIYPAASNTTGPALTISQPNGLTTAKIVGAGIDIPRVLELLADDEHEPVHHQIRQLINRIVGIVARPAATPSLSTDPQLAAVGGGRQ